MRLWELTRFAIENISRSRLRTVLTVAGIAIASGALVSMVGFILGLREQVETPVKRLGILSNIEVKRPSDSKAPLLDDEAVKKIEAIDGVDYAHPDLRLSDATLVVGSTSVKCSSIGIPREASLVGFARDLLTTGTFFSLGEEKEIMLSEALVPQLGFRSPEEAIGKTVELRAGGLVAKSDNKYEVEQQQMQLTVVGIYEPPEFATSLSSTTVLMPVDTMRDMPSSWMENGLEMLTNSQGLLGKGFRSLTIRAESPSDVVRVEKQIQEMGFSTYSVMDRMKEMRQFFVFMEVLLSAVGTVALIVAGLGILNTLTMTVMERYQEIGIYKSIGASHGDIRWMFLIEAAAVGLLGGIAGLGLARVVSWILAWAFNTYAAQQGVDGPEAVFVFPLWLLAGAVLYSMIISVVSGMYPASKAANIDPIVALRRG